MTFKQLASVLSLSVIAACGQLFAQTVHAFEFTPDTVSVISPSNVTEAIAELEIKSLSATDLTLRWQREVISLTQSCATKVCDLNACYPEQTSTKQFVLSAGAEGLISVHLVNDHQVDAQAIVRLDMWDVNNPADTIPTFYLFNATAVGTQEPLPAANVKVFPNPTTDYFTLQNTNEVARVRLLDFHGREITVFNPNTNNTYSVAEQPAGNYLLVIEDNKGRAFQIVQLNVKK